MEEEDDTEWVVADEPVGGFEEEYDDEDEEGYEGEVMEGELEDDSLIVSSSPCNNNPFLCNQH